MSASTESNRSVFSREPSTFDGKKGRQHTTSISVRGVEFDLNEHAKKQSWLARMWKTLDNDCMRPLLTSSKPTLIETLPECLLPCAKLCTSYEQMESSSYDNCSQNDGAEESEVFDMSYTEVGGGDSMVCSSPSKRIPLLNSGTKVQDYNAGFTS